MRNRYLLILISSILVLSSLASAQTLDGDWSVEYVTPDNEFVPNSTGQRTISVAALGEDIFVALAANYGVDTYYLVGYKNANHETGLLGTYPYSAEGLEMKWIDGFNQVCLHSPKDISSLENIVYVANNDVNHNIVTFELKDDSIYTNPKRFKTGSRDLWAIDVDKNGFVFVTVAGDSITPGSVLIYDGSVWNSQGTAGSLLHEIILPEPGEARGITVNQDGSILYVSNYLSKQIYCYSGDPVNGYTRFDGFSFSANTSYEVGSVTLDVGPWGLQFMDSKNLLFVGHDASFAREEGYNYGRYYVLNPNSGEILDTIDVAKWNFSQSGVYNNPDTLGTASGYAATYNLDFDENNNLYCAAYYGWSIEKWVYSKELPTIELTLTSVEVVNQTIPNEVSLKQNYPNPFNPSTTIEFQLNKQENISLKIFNLNGELVANLINKKDFGAGTYRVTFDASNLASGNYIYQLNTATKKLAGKMTFLK
ncbi:MAG: T9SS type A sorting domain-containing protein [Ignavibacteriales bacterium]|nr:T9SS type A sorting domain-containing protein [Ignavibacteriales bacterium]